MARELVSVFPFPAIPVAVVAAFLVAFAVPISVPLVVDLIPAVLALFASTAILALQPSASFDTRNSSQTDTAAANADHQAGYQNDKT